MSSEDELDDDDGDIMSPQLRKLLSPANVVGEDDCLKNKNYVEQDGSIRDALVQRTDSM